MLIWHGVEHGGTESEHVSYTPATARPSKHTGELAQFSTATAGTSAYASTRRLMHTGLSASIGMSNNPEPQLGHVQMAPSEASREDMSSLEHAACNCPADHHPAVTHHLLPAGTPRGWQAGLLHTYRAGDGEGMEAVSMLGKMG